MDNEILKIYNSIVSKYKFDDEIKKEKSIDEILNNNKTKAIWYISAIQCIEEKITKNFSEEETKKILYWILENKIKYSEGIFNSVFQIKFISQFYVLTINLLQSYTSRNIPIDEKDILMKECSNNIISITSLPVLFSNIEGLYENYSERLLKTLESSNMKTCNELQKCFISDVYTAPLMPLPNIANERVDSKLKDQKLSQSIYIVLLSFLEDMVRFYRIHSLDYDENQKIALCDKIESIVKFICGKIKKTSPSRTLCEKGLQIINNFEEIDINNKEQMKDASLLLEEILKER
ncbi:hypothetical protein BCR36DRAFT_31424 [Piromyces finnis]|uniref:Uncharacterized protein n=1 Tax=Piromyces finnis TaxID=1754191 RepID=A0A1Y1VDG7_9FUNG|nr:hypothetical protein BCR36DRAFT_31424 [Piromyces finnis]|eukprot:ORX52570.1 hypothetical protein BCR36DRAFT_31424 [Piromyces finnis]